MPDVLRLLFVGINKETRTTILTCLQNVHGEILEDTSKTSTAALALLKTRDYHIVVAEGHLPDADGLGWLEELRASGFSRPVLLLGSQDDSPQAPPLLLQGATEYIPQHLFTPEALTRATRQLFTIYQLQQGRLQAETELQSNKDLLKEAQKMARLGNWEVNLATKALTFSDEIFQILELDPLQPPDFDTVLARIHPQDLAYWRKSVEEALQHGTSYQVEYRILLPVNRVKYTCVHGYPVLNAVGETVGITGTLQDISDRVCTQNALKQSEKRYLMLLETMTEGVLQLDNDQIILYANKSFCDMMGYAKEEVIGQTFFRFIANAKTKELVDEKNLLRLQHISDHYEMELQRKDGTLIHFMVGASPLQDSNGVVTGSLGTFMNISERKKIEQALKSSEKLFRTLFEDSQCFLCTHTLNGTILSINKAGASLVGLKPKALQGKNLRQMLAPEAAADFAQYLLTTQEHKQATGIFRIASQNQEDFHYILYRNILYQEKGKDPYVIVSAQDITDRIFVEEELRQAKKVAEKSVKVKEQFLANISHEIRTPMNGIIGLTDVLQKMVTDEEQKGYLQAIQSSADKLLIIINDILDFSKIESGKIEFERTDFNPKRVLQESIQLFEAKAAEKDNRIKAIVDADVPELLTGDPGKLSQILNNLLSNAIKFTNNGLITVFVEVTAEQPDSCQLEFLVQDTGIGIPQNKIQSIFESFTQGSSDTTRKYGGTGLGLSITKQLVELQGGTITVKSKANQGSTFRFSLHYQKGQASDGQAILSTELPQINPEGLGKLTILLAEDNPINQILVKKVIGDWGYDLYTADNGRQALELFRQNRYDVILMDMQMPEMDGYEATSFIRQSPGPGRDTPIIALTAHASKLEAEKCLRAGANVYISKPFKPENLLAEIARLLQHSPQANELAAAHQTSEPMLISPINFINLNYLREMADGDEGFIAEIITMFMDQTPQNLKYLQEYSAAGNWKEVKALAHKMKSSVVMIGNKELEEILVNLQHFAVQESPTEQVPALIDQAVAICSGVITALQAELQILSLAKE